MLRRPASLLGLRSLSICSSLFGFPRRLVAMRSRCSGLMYRPLIASDSCALCSSDNARPALTSRSACFVFSVIFLPTQYLFPTARAPIAAFCASLSFRRIPRSVADRFWRVISSGMHPSIPSPPSVRLVSSQPGSSRNALIAKISMNARSDSGMSTNTGAIPGSRPSARRPLIQAHLCVWRPRFDSLICPRSLVRNGWFVTPT